MFIDARTVPDSEIIETDICIIGAGAAGITLAREFSGQPFQVSLLESGDLEFDGETQSLYDGENVGLPYFPLRGPRLRYFGGTTNHWGGYCQPFNALDFEKRDYVPYSGWPIERHELDVYYERAIDILGLDPEAWNIDFWREKDRFPTWPFMGERVTNVVSQLSPGDVRRFGKTYRDDVVHAANVTTYLNANVTQIETDETGKRVTRVHVACLSGSNFSVIPKIVILAAGGIENARILLLSNKQWPAGLGNQNDLVGRFFMEHPRFVAGKIVPANPFISTGFYGLHKVGQIRLRGYLSLSPEVQRQEQVTDVNARLLPMFSETFINSFKSENVRSLRLLVRALQSGKMLDQFGSHLGRVIADLSSWQKLFLAGAPVPLPNPVVATEIMKALPGGEEALLTSYLGDISVFALEEIFNGLPVEYIEVKTRVESAPNPNSRLTLSSERDALGQNRLQLDWQLDPLDRYSARRTLEVMGVELGRAGLGRMQIELDDEAWPDDLAGGSHHMGTTRMSKDPKQGVVDENSRLHGLSNMYIAGSSVFPTSGSGTPTLTLLALALRLADHLKEKLA